MISVIIVNFNSKDYLVKCVNSVLTSTTPIEVFVVDNGSQDRSLSLLKETIHNEPRVQIIENKINTGFARANNQAIPLTKGDYILFLNPDCLIDKDALETVFACIKSLPQAGMAGPLILNPDGTEQEGGRRAVPTPWRSFVRAFGLSRLRERYPRLFSDFLLHHQPLPACPVEVEAISGSCMLVKHDALLDVGPLDEGYFMHCEDLDWCMRFRQRGWKIMFVPEADVVHYQGTCSKAKLIFVEWHKHKGMLRFYGKFFRYQYPGVLFWIVGAGVWLRFTMVAIYYGIQKIKQKLKT